MTAADIKQFLLVYDIANQSLEVTEFGTDEGAALDAYEAAEAAHRGDGNFDIVLIGSDSIETIRTTHASYFGGAAERLDALLSVELSQHAATA
jgi:hypothetical protein